MSNPFPSNPLTVFLVFLKLGLTSFGGPIAHIGYFRKEFVARKAWLSDEQFSQLLAICQFLPGPASSQLGFCIGLQRGGWLGAIAAFVGFTMPSVILLLLFVQILPYLSSELGEATIRGLKILACAVVLDAVIGMSKKLCTEYRTRLIALATLVFLLISPFAFAQIIAVLGAGILGMCVLQNDTEKEESTQLNINISKGFGTILLIGFCLFFVGLPLLSSTQPSFLSVADAFYRAGAMVFGGGHVVLPMLEQSVVVNGWVSSDMFLSGYGASQAIPGPMFAFSAYLGAVMSTEQSYLMSMVALTFMFLPGFLLVAGILPIWQKVAENKRMRSGIAGVNAAVVGLLAAALYNPIFTSGITNITDVIIFAVASGLLLIGRFSPLWVLLWCVISSAVLTLV